MKIRMVTTALILAMAAPFGMAQEAPFLEIFPDDTNLTVGDSVKYSAIYWSDDSTSMDTTVTWAFDPDSLASVDSAGWLYAAAPGEGLLMASLDTLTAELEIEIEEDEEDDPEPEGGYLTLHHDSTGFVIGDTVQFYAYQGDSLLANDAVSWSLDGMEVGFIDADGLLSMTAAGFALVEAQSDNHRGAYYAIVSDELADSSQINTVTITRDSPNPNGYSVMSVVEEGEAWTMGGMPRPMNVLNGGQVFFPHNSLSQDIRIHVSLPRFFNTDNDTVDYGNDRVVAGVEFSVILEDSTQPDPFYFDTPVYTSLVFKRGLLNQLGILPEQLSLYFTEEDADTLVFDATGIEYTTVDSITNRIYASVAHFSKLTVAATPGSATSTDEEQQVPSTFTLHQNYPNPFNPETIIRYDVPARLQVSLAIYDVRGALVRSAEPVLHEAGSYHYLWSGVDQYGQSVPSGLYLLVMQAGDQQAAVKMMLLK